MSIHSNKNKNFDSVAYKETKAAMVTAEALCNKLVLLVGNNGSGKTAVLREIAGDINKEVLNVNLLLSSELLELTYKKRALQLSQILNSAVSEIQGTIVMDNLEILFDKDLKQDPLRLLKNLSRNKVVVASWNGRISGGKLFYAKVTHPEYRSYELKDEIVVKIDDSKN